MELDAAVSALAALSNAHRLRLYRLLIERGPSGMAAGEIAEAIGVSPSSLTFHIGALERAGLVRSWRRQRNVCYAVEIDRMRGLVTFLTEDCCNGHPEICGDLATGSAALCARAESEG